MRHTLKPGYAFKWDGREWETVVISEDVAAQARFTQFTWIDDAKCAAFAANGQMYAQTAVYTQNTE